ncbi:TonB-dependent receptor [Rhodobacterales bacterium HKCCE2091]|nr:TonB-dependent receptor [Rhodobacterales bacterium HKCCE2091]
MKRPATALSALCIAASAAAPAAAQDGFTLDTIIFSAGLTALEAARVGVTVDVLTAEDLAQSGDAQISDVLATVPGLSVSQNGPVGTSTSLRVRGLDGRYIPVLVNGIDMTDPSQAQTGFDFGALTAGGIERIEILRGSQSAVYGSEAIAGVINITTIAAPDTPGTAYLFDVEAGSYATARATFGVGTRFDRGTLAFSVTHLTTDGFSAADENDGNTEADGGRSTTATLGGSYEVTDALTMGFDLVAIDGFSEVDGFPPPTFTIADTAETQDSERRGARIWAAFDALGFSHDVALSYSRTDRNYPTGFTQTFRGERTELSWEATREFATSTLTFGAAASSEEFAADAVTGDYDIGSVYGEVVAAITPDLDVTASLRYDDHSVYGGQATGRIAAAWRPAPDWVVRASIGTGFRAPSLYELYGPFGDPTLEPEQSVSADLGVEYSTPGLTFGATVYRTEIDDLIQFAGPGYAQVAGTSVTQGVELYGDYAVTDAVSLFGNYTYADARDRNGDRLLRVPRHDLTLGVAAEFAPGWTGTLTAQHVADRLDVGGPVGDYTLANASIAYEIRDGVEIYGRVVNLLDEEYQTADGYGTSDRAFYIGLRSRF